jgi:hypothetical protein
MDADVELPRIYADTAAQHCRALPQKNFFRSISVHPLQSVSIRVRCSFDLLFLTF